MSGLEEVFHPDAADARRTRDAEKTLAVPAHPAEPRDGPEGASVIIPDVADLPALRSGTPGAGGNP